MSNEAVRTALITGRHPYDVIGLQSALRSDALLDVYPQDLDDFLWDFGENRRQYDALVFFNFHAAGDETSEWEQRARISLADLGATGQGIVILHHGLCAFRNWEFWSELCGIRDRRMKAGVEMDQSVEVRIADREHPITAGIERWTLVDEIYTMENAGEGCHPLMTTSHERSMSTLAWTRSWRQSRVFCLQCGHDDRAYRSPEYRKVLTRGIRWSARRLP